MDSNVERMVVALVYQMEALIDELADKGVVDRSGLQARVEKLVTAANAAAEGDAPASAADGDA
jgi:hypothetical protein